MKPRGLQGTARAYRPDDPRYERNARLLAQEVASLRTRVEELEKRPVADDGEQSVVYPLAFERGKLRVRLDKTLGVNGQGQLGVVPVDNPKQSLSFSALSDAQAWCEEMRENFIARGLWKES